MDTDSIAVEGSLSDLKIKPVNNNGCLKNYSVVTEERTFEGEVTGASKQNKSGKALFKLFLCSYFQTVTVYSN